MKSTTVRRTTVAVAVATALTGAAACSAPDSSAGPGKGDRTAGTSTARPSPIAALRAAEKSTRRAVSARVRSTTTMGSLLSMTADGALTWGDGVTGTLTLTYTGGTVADTMRRTGSTSMQARYLRDAYYARMGDAFARQAGGRHWVKYAYDDLADLGGGTGAYLEDQMRNTTPDQSVRLLLASGDVREAGEETISGAHTTHYSGTVRVADLATRDSGLGAGELAALKKRLTQAGVTTETVDIWVDDQDLLVKKVEKADMAAGAMTQTAYYSDYGTKVSAEEPPAADTQDFTTLLRQQGATGTS